MRRGPIRSPHFSTRLLGQLILGALVSGMIVACATKTSPSGEETGASAGKPTPTPAASPSPTPEPTPVATYSATVKVLDADGNPVVDEPSVTPTPTASPSPTPDAGPTPEATPAASPTPRPSGNVFTRTWARIFPPKPTPTPALPPLSAAEFRVSTDGSTPPPALGANEPPAPSPTPIMLRKRPTEGFFSRMWHKVFPKKQEPPVAAPPAWIGSVRLVNERENYALIDAPNYLTLPAGETLNSVGNTSESGVLRVSADRNPPFFIADIVSGRPRAGDRVYSPKPAGTPSP